jgi:hypothetical protein
MESTSARYVIVEVLESPRESFDIGFSPDEGNGKAIVVERRLKRRGARVADRVVGVGIIGALHSTEKIGGNVAPVGAVSRHRAGEFQ